MTESPKAGLPAEKMSNNDKQIMPMLVTDIIWDTDGYEADLPNEVEVPDGLSDDEVADYLSDTYGWLVSSFALPMDDGDCDEFGEYVNKAEGMAS